jgi:hypothetical protein
MAHRRMAIHKFPRATLFLFTLLLPLPSLMMAQESGNFADGKPARETDYTLTFSKAFVQPGNEASVMVLFAQKPGVVPVQRLRAKFSFPNKVLSFERMENAYLSRRAKLQMKAAPGPGAKDGEGTLELRYELPADSNADFPSGQIATLIFKVSSPAEDQVIRIDPDAWIDDKPILPNSPDAQVEYGLVKVTQVPVIVGCFFFTH